MQRRLVVSDLRAWAEEECFLLDYHCRECRAEQATDWILTLTTTSEVAWLAMTAEDITDLLRGQGVVSKIEIICDQAQLCFSARFRAGPPIAPAKR